MILDRKLKAAKAAFDVSIDRGITFFDTAEVYGSRVRNMSYYSFILIHWMHLKKILSVKCSESVICLNNIVIFCSCSYHLVP